MSSKILLNNGEGLVGDFLGTIPAMQQLARDNMGIHVIIHPEAEKIFKLIPAHYNIVRAFHREYPEDYYTKSLSLDISKAFSIADQKKLYMSQTHYEVLGLPIPHVPPRAELDIEEIGFPTYDVLLAPFARSLPPQEKWAREKWQQLVDRFPHIKFGLLGTKTHDDPEFLKGYNVTAEFDHNFMYVSNLMKKCTVVLSVVTGISHLCFHLDVPNLLINNQNFTWGTNPKANNIRTPIPTLKVDEVVDNLKKYLD